MKQYIIVIFSLIPFFVFYQSKEKDDIYILVDNKNFFGHKGSYSINFILKSEDEKFKHDTYNFSVTDFSLGERNIYSLGTEININGLAFIDPRKYFLNNSPCYVHEELSKWNLDKNIFIITKIPLSINREELGGKFFYWKAQYTGTVKGVIYTQLGKGPFFTEK